MSARRAGELSRADCEHVARVARRAFVALVVAVALCVVIVSGCGGDESGPTTPAGEPELVGTQWVLDVSALGVSDAGSVSSWIAFARGGRVTDNDGCNAFSGRELTDPCRRELELHVYRPEHTTEREHWRYKDGDALTTLRPLPNRAVSSCRALAASGR